jgi:hypothetical protein
MANRPWKIPSKKRFYGAGKGARRHYAPAPDKDAAALALIAQALRAGKRVTSEGMSAEEVKAKFGSAEYETE